MRKGSPNHNYAFASALVDELARCDVRHAIVCPGSRSTPLALALAEDPEIETFTHIDERAAGFFALGLAKTTRRPVVLVCTSGTAAANFHPAVVEASYTATPLLVLTADRPPELREWGAGQTIDQTRLYGSHVRWFVETPIPEPDAPRAQYARALACRAVDAATRHPAGPVHLNLPFREPLDPRPVPSTSQASSGRASRAPYTRVSHASGSPTPSDTADLVAGSTAARRGVVVAGPLESGPDVAAAIAELVARLGWPLLAEPASQLRCGPHVDGCPVIAGADLLLRDVDFANTHAPDFVLRFGATPTSKAQRLWLEQAPPERLVLVDPDRTFQDPSHLATDILCVDEVALCDALLRRLPQADAAPNAWLDAWITADARARDAIETAIGDTELLEPHAVLEVARGLGSPARVLVSNSMPIRLVDALWPASNEPLRFFSHRGANGIDGLVASAAGIAADPSGGPVVLLTGDLAFLHDVSGLLAAKRQGTPLTVVVLDNDGGGIFSHLPVARSGDPAHFETFFRTPHGTDPAAIAAGAGARATRITSTEHLHACLKEALASPELSILVVPVDRDASLEQFQSLVRAAASAA